MQVTGTIYLMVSSIIFLALGYLLNIWLGRFLGPEKYGSYGIVISLMAIINLIQTSGVPQVLSKYIAEDEKKSEQILKSGLVLQILTGITIFILYFLLAKPLALLLKDISLTPYIRLSAMIFPAYGIYTLYLGYHNGLHNFKKQALLGMIYSIGKVFFIIAFTFVLGIRGAIIGFMVSPLIAFLFGFHYPRNVKETFPYKKLIFFSLPLIGFAFLSSLQLLMDLFFVKALLGSKNAPGYYTANQNISQILFFGLSAFSVVLFPSISRSVSNNTHNITKKLICDSLRYVTILLAPGVLLISATAKPLLQLIYSSKYIPGAESLSVLVIGIGCLTLFTVLANILNGAGEPKKSLWIAALGVIITAILCWILVPKYGLDGAALSTTIGSFVSMVIATYFVYQRFHALVSIKSVMKIIFASSIIYFLAKMITIPILLLPVLYIFLFAVYVGILIILKEITFEDWKQVKSLIPSWVPFVNNV